MEDERIIALYFERSEDAIKETDIKYGRLCFDVANNILNSRTDSEECVNDTYLKLWSVIPPTVPQNFRAFICKITRNLSLMRFRHNSAKKRAAEMEISLSEMESVLPDESISESVADEYIGEAINEFLGILDEDALNIFVRKYWFFDTVQEIALRYSFSEGKVKTSLYRSREKLRKFLIEKGIRI